MQYFHIKNDPRNSLLDMLPRYALEMRGQDIQNRQFRKQQALAEKTQKEHTERQREITAREKEESSRAATRLGMTTERFGWEEDAYTQKLEQEQAMDVFLRKNQKSMSDYRLKIEDYEAHVEKYSGPYDDYKELTEGKKLLAGQLGYVSMWNPRTKKLENKTLGNISWIDYLENKEARFADPKWKVALKEARELPDLTAPNIEMEFKDTTRYTPAMFDYVRQTMKTTEDETISYVSELLGLNVGRSDLRASLEGGRTLSREEKEEDDSTNWFKKLF
tara:strand:+ start:2091 stop:2918 length:828 start_codon:yes stop_codon:yes gene_type:complete